MLPSATLVIAQFLDYFPYFTGLSDLQTNKSNKFKINLIVFQLVTYFFSCKRLQYLQLSKTFYNICSNKNTHTMKTLFKKFTILYQFDNSVWSNERMTVEAITIEQAREKVLKEISCAYGSQILNEVTILS